MQAHLFLFNLSYFLPVVTYICVELGLQWRHDVEVKNDDPTTKELKVDPFHFSDTGDDLSCTQ